MSVESSRGQTSTRQAPPASSDSQPAARQQVRNLHGGVFDNARREFPGKIEVAPRAIATVAGRAVAECYGVVGIAARHPRFGVVELLTPEQYGRGVEVRFSDDYITIDVYVALEHGLRITEIAHNIMASVKFAVERTLELRVVRVNVNVQALRVSGAE
ncbi:MAG: Asp23/Gls24 family envelope stress response protein [Ktedonobacterales bacterium]